jgi:hypothetical protein
MKMIKIANRWMYRFGVYRGDDLILKVISDTEHGAWLALQGKLDEQQLNLFLDDTLIFIATYSRTDDLDLKKLQYVEKDGEDTKWMKGNSAWYLHELIKKYK